MDKVMKRITNITNREMRKLVEKRVPFVNGNKTVFSHIQDNGLYVVYSYGYHFPMAIHEPQTGMWFFNLDKSSRTTNRHKTLIRPYGVNSYNLTSGALQELAVHGYSWLVQQRLMGVAA